MWPLIAWILLLIFFFFFFFNDFVTVIHLHSMVGSQCSAPNTPASSSEWVRLQQMVTDLQDVQSFQREDSQLSQAVPGQVQVDDGQQGTLEAAPPLQLELRVLAAGHRLELVTKELLRGKDAGDTVVVIIVASPYLPSVCSFWGRGLRALLYTKQCDCECRRNFNSVESDTFSGGATGTQKRNKEVRWENIFLSATKMQSGQIVSQCLQNLH